MISMALHQQTIKDLIELVLCGHVLGQIKSTV